MPHFENQRSVKDKTQYLIGYVKYNTETPKALDVKWITETFPLDYPDSLKANKTYGIPNIHLDCFKQQQDEEYGKKNIQWIYVKTSKNQQV